MSIESGSGLSPEEAARLYTQNNAALLRGSEAPFHPANLNSANERYNAELFERASQSGQPPHFPTREEATGKKPTG